MANHSRLSVSVFVSAVIALLIFFLLPASESQAVLLGMSKGRLLLFFPLILYFSGTLVWLGVQRFATDFHSKLAQKSTDFLIKPARQWIGVYVSVIFFVGGLAISLFNTLTTDESLSPIIFRSFPYIFLIIFWGGLGLYGAIKSNLLIKNDYLFIASFITGLVIMIAIPLPFVSWSDDLRKTLAVVGVIGFSFSTAIFFPNSFSEVRKILGLLLSVVAFSKLQYLIIPPDFRGSSLVILPFVVLIVTSGMLGFIGLELHKKRWGRSVLLVVGFVVLAFLFVVETTEYAATKNINLGASDQNVFVTQSYEMKENNFFYIGWGNQAPLYMMIQAIFIDLDMSQLEIFEQGKLINIGFSLLLIPLIYWLVVQVFKPLTAVGFTLVAMLSIFYFKAPHYQVETLYYFFVLLCFILLNRMMIAPSYKLAVLTGVGLALGQYAKSSFLPTVLAIFLVYGFDWLVRSVAMKDKFDWKRLSYLGVLLIAFFTVMSYYMRESNRIFGSYFYNVNSSYVFWNDSLEEFNDNYFDVAERYDVAGFDLNEVPQEELTTRQKYLESHSLLELIQRLLFGFQDQFRYFFSVYSFYNYLHIYFWLFIGLLVSNFKSLWSIIREHATAVLFSLCFFAGFFILLSWFSYLAEFPDGRRYIMAFFLPMIFGFLYLMERLWEARPEIKLFGIYIKARNLYYSFSIYLLLALWFDFQFFMLPILNWPGTYFGK